MRSGAEVCFRLDSKVAKVATLDSRGNFCHFELRTSVHRVDLVKRSQLFSPAEVEEFFPFNFATLSSVDLRASCRSRQELSNEYLYFFQILASIQPRTGLSKFAKKIAKSYKNVRKNIHVGSHKARELAEALSTWPRRSCSRRSPRPAAWLTTRFLSTMRQRVRVRAASRASKNPR